MQGRSGNWKQTKIFWPYTIFLFDTIKFIRITFCFIFIFSSIFPFYATVSLIFYMFIFLPAALKMKEVETYPTTFSPAVTLEDGYNPVRWRQQQNQSDRQLPATNPD